MSPQYTLTYFDVMGRAEPARLLFAYARVSYIDKRVTWQEWDTLKPTTLFGHLPMLEIDGKVLAESQAIFRYLAGVFGLKGKDAWEEARCDMLVVALEEVFTELYAAGWYFEKDPEKKKYSMAKVTESTINPLHSRYEKFLAENATGFFVGDQITYADIVIFDYLSGFATKYGLLDRFQLLKDFATKIGKIPQIKEWVEKRPKNAF